jgi:hypothetical protein
VDGVDVVDLVDGGVAAGFSAGFVVGFAVVAVFPVVGAAFPVLSAFAATPVLPVKVFCSGFAFASVFLPVSASAAFAPPFAASFPEPFAE